ncbi:MAG: ABC transporter permease [Acidimicrobiia bacterium]|nr:ABC transporter permease [Acidimicrobiia bacterium]
MSAALLIALIDLRRRVRDRSLIIFGIVAPIVLATIIGLAFGDGGDFEVRIGLVDEDRSEVSSSVAAALTGAEGDSPLRFQPVASAAAARDGVVADDLGAALVIPAGFGASLAGEEPLGITVVRGSDDLFSGDIAIGVAQGVAAQIDASRLAAATAIAAGADPETAVERAMTLEPALPVDESVLGGEVNVAAYMAPSMAMLFLFFTVGAGARSLLTEQREGTLTRLRSSPVTNAQILGGKLIAVVATGLLSLVVVYGVSTAALGVDWGDPLGVLVVIVAAVLAVAGIGTFVTALARTDAQAEGYTTMLTFGLALLGGNFTPPGDMTDLMRRLSLATPNGWALRGFTQLSAGHGGVRDIVPHVAVLLGIAGLTGAVGLGLLSRRVSR